MWVLYSTLGSETQDENAIYIGDLPTEATWSDVRRRTGGLIRKAEPCFLWNGQDFELVHSEDQNVTDRIVNDVLRIKLTPLNGAHLAIRTRRSPENEKSSVTTSSKPVSGSASLTTSSLSAMVPPFDAKSTERVLSEVADTAKKVSSLMGATFTSWAKTATETVKEVAASEKKFEQIGPIRIRIGKKIAEGGFSEVYIAKGPENESYALKKCRAQTAEQLAQLKREISAHSQVEDAEYIMRLLASDITPSEGRGSIVRFVFPLCEGGSWFDAFQKRSGEEETLRIFLGASKGLKSLHEKNILHRDVKPHNVLLTGDGHPLLMDLGSSCPLPIKIGAKSAAALLAEEAAEQCSAPYRAPELWEPKVGKNIAGEADVWSLGCTLFAVTFGKGYSPYEDAIQGVLKLAIITGSPVKFPASAPYSDFCKNIISRTVTSTPSSRMTLEDIIREVENRLNH